MDNIKLRQICFYFACMMPAAKLLIYPATLAYDTKNDLLLAAGLNFAAQVLVLGAVLWLSARTDRTFFALLEGAFGRLCARIVYCLCAAFFLFSALFPMLEQRVFVTQVLYENVPSVLVYTPFFAVSFFACLQGLRTLGRAADVAMPLFAVSFVALILLAAPHADFGALLPVGRTGAGIFRGALFLRQARSPCWCSLPCFTGSLRTSPSCARTRSRTFPNTRLRSPRWGASIFCSSSR